MVLVFSGIELDEEGLLRLGLGILRVRSCPLDSAMSLLWLAGWVSVCIEW